MRSTTNHQPTAEPGEAVGVRFLHQEPSPMGLKLPLRYVWRALQVITGVLNAGRLFSGVLEMLDRLDH